MTSPMTKAITILVLGSLLIACSDGSDNRVNQGPPNPFAGFVSATYSDVDNWLCHPSLKDADDVCAGNLDATRVFADGSTEIETHVREADPKVDCFYVYPTCSGDPSLISDLEDGPEEIYATLTQAARYSRFCRVFAPVYRQETLRELNTNDGGNEARYKIAYIDVLVCVAPARDLKLLVSTHYTVQTRHIPKHCDIMGTTRTRAAASDIGARRHPAPA